MIQRRHRDDLAPGGDLSFAVTARATGRAQVTLGAAIQESRWRRVRRPGRGAGDANQKTKKRLGRHMLFSHINMATTRKTAVSLT